MSTDAEIYALNTPGCVQPLEGQELSRHRDEGRPLPAHLRSHLQSCLACQLEWRRWNPTEYEISPPVRPAFRDALCARVMTERAAVWGRNPNVRHQNDVVRMMAAQTTSRDMTTTIHPTFDVTWTEDGALSVRWSNQPQRDARLLEAKQQSQIEDLVRNLGEAEATKDLGDKKDSGINAARQKLGTALFDLIDGPARTLTHLRETSRTSGPPLNLTIRLFSRKSLALHPAAQWRWELVYDGEPLGVGLPIVRDRPK